MLLLWLLSFCLDVWLRKKMFSLSLSLFLTNLHLKSIFFFVYGARMDVCVLYMHMRAYGLGPFSFGWPTNCSFVALAGLCDMRAIISIGMHMFVAISDYKELMSFL